MLERRRRVEVRRAIRPYDQNLRRVSGSLTLDGVPRSSSIYISFPVFTSTTHRGIGLSAMLSILFFAPSVSSAQTLTPSAQTGFEFNQQTGQVAFNQDQSVERVPVSPGSNFDRGNGIANQFSIGNLNPDGIFAATYTTTLVPGAGGAINETRQIFSSFYQENGSFDQQSRTAPGINRPVTGFEPTPSYNPSVDGGLTFSLPVAAELREAAARGASHLGNLIQPFNRQGESVIGPDGIANIEVTEYYEDPFDAVPDVAGTTTFAYRGHEFEPLSDGGSAAYNENNARFQVLNSPTNAFSLLIDPDDPTAGFSTVDLPLSPAPYAIGDVITFDDRFSSGFGVAPISLEASFIESFGTIEILDIAYDQGDVTRLDALFIQTPYDDLNAGTTFFGESKLFARLQFNVVAIPEPASAGVLSLAAGLVAMRRRRR